MKDTARMKTVVTHWNALDLAGKRWVVARLTADLERIDNGPEEPEATG